MQDQVLNIPCFRKTLLFAEKNELVPKNMPTYYIAICQILKITEILDLYLNFWQFTVFTKITVTYVYQDVFFTV